MLAQCTKVLCALPDFHSVFCLGLGRVIIIVVVTIIIIIIILLGFLLFSLLNEISWRGGVYYFFQEFCLFCEV